MKRRLQKYIAYIFVSYVPGTSKLATMEAMRLSKYIFETYTGHQQLIILDEIKNNLKELHETQIRNEELKIFQSEIELKNLKSNFNKLNNLK